MSSASTATTGQLDAKSWAAIGEYLQGPNVQLLSEEKRESLLEQWQDVTHQEENLEDAILIGLVGGTGVGKSTFINGLAGERVSRSSDRRPTTDRVVVYRHVNTDIPGDVPSNDFAQPEVLHDNNGIEKVVLFDFPDFDSAEDSHTHIIRRYLPYLDVLLVVVDDVKYADRRLYELLSTLDHDPQNVFVMMNKVDRLDDRYGDKTEQVIVELMADLDSKLKQNSGLSLAANQKFPIAALSVLEAREKKEQSPAFERFGKVERMLESFQEDKHRRAAKERNIDSRKRDLTTDLSGAALGKENSAILTEARKLVSGWRDALDKALQNVPVEILGDSERSGVRGTRLRQVGPGWGLPFSLFFTLLGEIRRRSSKSVVPADLGQRVMLHYRGFFEAVKNVRSRFESEFSGSQIQVTEEESDTTTLLKLSPTDLATEMQGAIEQEREHIPIMRRWLAHIPALVTLALIFWSQIYDILDDETSIFGAIFEVMNPSFIVGMIFAVLAAYAITSFVIWLREIQKVDHRVTKAEQATREIVRKSGQQAVDQLDANVNALYVEFESLKKMVG